MAFCLVGVSRACFPGLIPGTGGGGGATAAAKCEDGWSHLGTKCYKLFTDKVKTAGRWQIFSFKRMFVYPLISCEVSWEAARLTCACSNSGELVSITSAEENTLVNDTAGDTENTWIGGVVRYYIDNVHGNHSNIFSGAHDIGAENTFEWSDGTAWSYTNWRENHPNNGGTDGNQVRNSGQRMSLCLLLRIVCP